MAGIKTIYNRIGEPLADIRAAVTRSSLLRDIGEAMFEVPTTSIKCRRRFLEFGNFIVVRHETLPDWVGFIDTPRIWRKGYVEIHAYEPALLLDYRFAPLNTRINSTPGLKVSQLIDLANAQEDTLIRTGNIFSGGTPSEQVFNGSVYSHIKSQAVDNGHDWLTLPKFDSTGKLSIEFNWYEKAGADTNVVLAEGRNIQFGDAPLEESGEILNHIEAVTDVDASEGTPQVHTFSEASPYGKRARRFVLTGSADSAGLLTYAEQTVIAKRSPSLSTPLTVIDAGGTFNGIRLGNRVMYKYSTIGFGDNNDFGLSRQVRIEGYRFDERLNTCELFTGVA